MSSKNYDFLFRINHVGDINSGKTSLFIRFTQDSFIDYHSEDYISTIGQEKKIKNIEIENKLIRCIIWDAYQPGERLRITYVQTSPRILRNSNGVILIYDITNLKSFKLIKDFNEEIKENAPNIKKILVGTKCDLEDKRQVTEEEGKKLANELGINMFFEVSAKTGKNVEEAYYSLFREILMNYNQPEPIILNSEEKINEKSNKCAK